MRAISPATQMILSLSMLKGVGPAALKKAVQMSRLDKCGVEEFATNIPQIERALSGEGEWVMAQEKALAQIEEAERHLARIISPADADYPTLLAATRDDPCILFVKGTLFQNPKRSVAIIGTREPTYHGEMIGRRITHFFVEQGWSIVSGLAIGCDAIAHQAALEAKGHTVAVLAHGLQMIAPSRHQKLAQDILAAGGALVSEYPFGQAIQKQQYVKRDRTQAGLAQGVVMVQSDLKGGSLHASRAALDYDRWLAVPFPTDKDRAAQEPKVQANLRIAEGSEAEKVELLRCKPSALKRIITLRGRDDYLLMLSQTPYTLLNDARTNSVQPLPKVSTPREPVLDLFESAQPDAITENDQQLYFKPSEKSSLIDVIPSAQESGSEVRNYRIVFGSSEDIDASVSHTLSEFSASLEPTLANEHVPYLAGRLQFIQSQIETVSKWRFSDLNNGRRVSKSYVLVCLEEAVGQMKRVVKGLEPWSRLNITAVNGTTESGRKTVNAGGHQNHNECAIHKCLEDVNGSSQGALLYLLDPDAFVVSATDDIDGLFVLTSQEQPTGHVTVVHFSDLVCSFNQLVEVTLGEDRAARQPERFPNSKPNKKLDSAKA